MFMTDYEISFSYRTARFRNDQIKVLAELNNVPVADMQEKLASLGYQEVKKFKPKRGRNMKAIDSDRLVSLYHQGLNDQQIAEVMGLKERTIASWRVRNGLPCRRKNLKKDIKP